MQFLQPLADGHGNTDRSGPFSGGLCGRRRALNLDFGTLQLGSGTQDLQFQIENLPSAYRAGLALESVMAPSDPGGLFSTDATPFAELPAGQTSGSWSCSSVRRNSDFSGEVQLDLSDEQDLSGWAGGQTLTLNVTAEVVPEPSARAVARGRGGHCARRAWSAKKKNRERKMNWHFLYCHLPFSLRIMFLSEQSPSD